MKRGSVLAQSFVYVNTCRLERAKALERDIIDGKLCKDTCIWNGYPILVRSFRLEGVAKAVCN